MERIKHFLFCFVPFLLALLIQVAVILPITGLNLIRLLYSDKPSIEIFNSLFKDLTGGTGAVMVSLIFGIVCLIVFGTWYLKRYYIAGTSSVKKAMNAPIIVGIFLLTIGFQYLINYLVGIIAILFPAWLAQYERIMDSVGFTQMTPILLIYSCLVAPVSEELIFRGVTLHHARKYMPFWLANTIQAILFGTMHMNIVQGIYAFILGLVLGYICHAGNSLYISILFHMIFNFIGSYLPSPVVIFGNSLTGIASAFIVTILITVIGACLYQKGILLKFDRPNAHD